MYLDTVKNTLQLLSNLLQEMKMFYVWVLIASFGGDSFKLG